MSRGPIISRDERASGLAFARQWRIATKPYFDVIYGPETRRGRCPTCDGLGFVTVRSDGEQAT